MSKKKRAAAIIVVVLLVLAMAIPSFSMLFYALR